MSAKPDEKPEKFKIPEVKFGTTDFYNEFVKTTHYALLYEFTKAYDNMDIDNTMEVQLVDEAHDFSTINELKKQVILHELLSIIYVKMKFTTYPKNVT